MSRRGRKRERESLLEARREQDQAKFRASVPFTREELEQLLEHLSRLEPSPEPFGHTRRWAAERGFDWEAIAIAFASRDICSDGDVFGANPYELFGSTPRRTAWMPIERDQLEGLMTHLDELGESGVECDHTPRHTAEWLKENRHPARETLAALKALGGNCDCEMANVDPDWIYPPRLALVVDPPKPRPAAPRPTEYRDDAMVFSLPGKPWRLRTDSKQKIARLVLQFGSGYLKPELRVLAIDKPVDERAWCLERWRQLHLDGRTEIVGPESVDCAGVPARWYLSKGKGHPIDAGWCLVDFAGGCRVMELDVSTGTWDPFHREAKKLLATIRSA